MIKPYPTSGQLFDLAIQAEQVAEAGYRRLARIFEHHAGVAEFWLGYAEQEAQHARWLAQIRERFSPLELESPEDPAMVERLRQVTDLSVEELFASVQTLDDAYLLVSDLENSETNVVFEFLVDRYAQDARAQTFLRAQLRDHVGDLMVGFPARFGNAEARRSVNAVH